MLRSLRHIAETIDAVMVAEGIEHVEDVIALRDLGLRYGQGYYMARPGPPFPTLTTRCAPSCAACRRSLARRRTSRRATIPTTTTTIASSRSRRPAVATAPGVRDGSQSAIPQQRVRAPRGRDHERLRDPGHWSQRPRPRASEPPATGHAERRGPPRRPWQPLSDDEATGEALLSSLRKPGSENAPEGEPGPGRPGLN